MRQPSFRPWLLLSIPLALVGCPGENNPGDAGPGPIDAPIPPGTDAPIPPGTDAPISPTDVGPIDGGPDMYDDLCHPTGMSDSALADEALRIIGYGSSSPMRRCNECHAITRARMRQWAGLTDTVLAGCLADRSMPTDAEAATTLTCLEDPEAGEITPQRLGIFAAAARLGWFQYLFRHGSTGDWLANHSTFVERAGMPRPAATEATPLTQAEFDVVCDWFERGIPNVDAVLPADGSPTECLPYVSPEATAYIASMATTGWGARNRTSGMLMYGCAGATSPADCLSGEPLASSLPEAANWTNIPTGGVAGETLRLLYTTSYASAWWTRSSPDGRFVAHGAARAPNFRFIDLTTDVVITGAADYDPDFFPDAAGFMVQGGGRAGRMCRMSVLTSGPTSLTFNETGCTTATGVGLYQHLGTSLDGGDYWAISSNKPVGTTYDNGGQDPTFGDPAADFGGGAQVTFNFFTNGATTFTHTGSDSVVTPYEGDHVFSPSLGMLIARIAGPSAVPIGYALHRVVATPTGAGDFDIELPEIARYCGPGSKPSISYDERFMVTHHYISNSNADAIELGFTGRSDAGFAMYATRGAANIYMTDLVTGIRYRLTNMGPGQYALFPHFRSDGWIYFMVRTESATPEHVVASDAALIVGG